MGIARREPAVVLNLHEVAVSVTPAGRNDSTVRHRHDRCTGRRAEVDSEMRTDAAQNGMQSSSGKAGSHAWIELQRRSQQSAFYGVTLFIVVLIFEEEGTIRMTGIHQFRGLDLSVFYERSVVILRVDDYANLIA